MPTSVRYALPYDFLPFTYPDAPRVSKNADTLLHCLWVCAMKTGRRRFPVKPGCFTESEILSVLETAGYPWAKELPALIRELLASGHLSRLDPGEPDACSDGPPRPGFSSDEVAATSTR